MTDSRDSLLAECSRLMAAGRWNEATSRLEQALVAAPTDVLIAFSLATAYRQSAELEKAEALFARLHAALPDMPEAVIGLAQSRAEQGRQEDAAHLLRAFLIRNPAASAAVESALGTILLKSGHPTMAVTGFERAARLAPSAQTLGNLAEIKSLHRHFDAAEPLYKQALALAPELPSLRLNYAVHLLSQGKVRDGWVAFEARLCPEIPDAPIRKIPLERWDGTKPENRHILVASEQGLGDEIRFSALLPALAARARKVTVECDPRLVPIFARSFPDLEVRSFSRVKRAGHGQYSYGWLPAEDGPDCYIDLGSLPLMLNWPYEAPDNKNGFLRPLPDRVRQMRSILSDASDETAQAPGEHMRLVGLSWASSANHFGRAGNYPPLPLWKDLLCLPNVRFVSLQHDPSGVETRNLAEMSGREVLHLPDLDLRNDLESLAALEAALDLVLSIGNATGALAGAIGTPVIELVSTPGWVPLIGERDCFIGATRRVAQTAPGSWEQPLERAFTLAKCMTGTSR